MQDETLVVDRFYSHVHARPMDVAIEDAQGATRYCDLLRDAEQVDDQLAVLGVGSDEVVAIFGKAGKDAIAAILGCWLRGAAFVYVDIRLPRGRASFIVDDAKAVAGIILDESGPRVFAIKKDRAPGRKCAVRNPLSLAYCIYTSGSSGAPKAVAVQQNNLALLINNSISEFQTVPGSRISQFASLSFDIAIWEICMSVASGSTLVFVPDAVKADPVALVGWLVDQNITTSYIPTAVCHTLLKQAWPVSCSMTRLFTGGEQLMVNAVQLGVPDTTNLYGPTEATIMCTSFELPRSESSGPASIGSALPGYQVRLLNSRLEDVQEGEIFIGGSGIARGYLSRPRLTAESFIPDPSDCGKRMYRTGDRGKIDDVGRFQFVGREDGQVKVNGFRVELGEIEAALRANAGVAEAVVATRRLGESNEIVAYIKTTEGGNVDRTGLRSALKSALPHYMLPSAIIQIDSLPLTMNGKIDRGALLELADHKSAMTVTPTAGVRGVVLDAWLKILGPDADKNDEASFFDCGGHSMSLLLLLGELKDKLGVDIPLREVYEECTLGLLVQVTSSLAGAIA